jgi:hypothetical protein
MVLTDSTVEVDVNWPCRPSHRTGCNSHAALALFTVQAVEKLKNWIARIFMILLGILFTKPAAFCGGILPIYPPCITFRHAVTMPVSVLAHHCSIHRSLKLKVMDREAWRYEIWLQNQRKTSWPPYTLKNESSGLGETLGTDVKRPAITTQPSVIGRDPLSRSELSLSRLLELVG